jgi:hypothetical protein
MKIAVYIIGALIMVKNKEDNEKKRNILINRSLLRRSVR